jgi:hypothetical protein
MSADENQTTQGKGTRGKQKTETDPGISWRDWLGSSLRNPHNLPHYLTAIFTLGLAIFAWKAWQEAPHSTTALQDQVLAIKAYQRPLIWVTGYKQPAYQEEPGQVSWEYDFENIGKSVAYGVIERSYIKIGNEKYQPGRIMAGNVEASSSEPADIPPGLKGIFATVTSRPGINKDYFNKMLKIDGGVGFLVEFHYLDASGKTAYDNAVCIARLATSALAFIPPADCPHETNEYNQ